MKWEINKELRNSDYKKVHKFAWLPIKAYKEGVEYMVWLDKYYSTYRYINGKWVLNGNWTP